MWKYKCTKTDLRWLSVPSICSVCSSSPTEEPPGFTDSSVQNVTFLLWDQGQKKFVQLYMSWHRLCEASWVGSVPHRRCASPWMSRFNEWIPSSSAEVLFIQLQPVLWFFPFVQQFYSVCAARVHAGVLAFDRPWELREFALVVNHLQVLDVLPDVAGVPLQEAVIWAWRRTIHNLVRVFPPTNSPPRKKGQVWKGIFNNWIKADVTYTLTCA